MNAMIWAVQAILALVFFGGAATRAVGYEFAKTRMAWVAAVPRPLLLFISVAEIAGALGPILPGLTGVASVLTPVAAVALAVILVLAFAFHLSRRQTQNAAANVLLLAVVVFVAVARFGFAPL